MEGPSSSSSSSWVLIARSDEFRKYGHSGAVVATGDAACLYLFGGCLDDGRFSEGFVCLNLGDRHVSLVEETGDERPYARHFHSSVYYGGFFYIFGGKSNGYHNDLWKFVLPAQKDPALKDWRMVKPISDQSKLFARFGQSAVLFSGALYVFGGYDQHGFCCDGLHAFQFARNAWFRELKTMGSAKERYHHSAVVHERSMYIFGGRSDHDALGDLLEYHFDARSWTVLTTTGTPPSKRWGHSAAVVGERMYVFGGCDGSSCYGDMHEYDFRTRHWALVEVPHCLAEDAEVLTSRGFLGMRDVLRGRGGALCGGIDPKSGQLRWERPVGFVLNHGGSAQSMVDLVLAVGGERVLRVTGDHDMWVGERVVKARSLVGAGSVCLPGGTWVAARWSHGYEGATWCVTMPSKQLVARERGAQQAIVVGNCPAPRYFQFMCSHEDRIYIVGGKDLWGRCFDEVHEV